MRIEIIEDTGHFPQVDEIAQTNALLDSFLASLPQAESRRWSRRLTLHRRRFLVFLRDASRYDYPPVGNFVCPLRGSRQSRPDAWDARVLRHSVPTHSCGRLARQIIQGKNMQIIWAVIIGAIAGFIARWISPSPLLRR